MKTKNFKKSKELKKIPTGSNWKKVLLEICIYSPHNYGESHKVRFYDGAHPLAKKLKISGYELGLAISFLRDHGLIKDRSQLNPLDEEPINPYWSNMVSLTEKGFNVALEVDKQLRDIAEKKRFERLHLWLVILTGLLVLSSLINIFF